MIGLIVALLAGVLAHVVVLLAGLPVVVGFVVAAVAIVVTFGSLAVFTARYFRTEQARLAVRFPTAEEPLG
jgi:hypothetical protein